MPMHLLSYSFFKYIKLSIPRLALATHRSVCVICIKLHLAKYAIKCVYNVLPCDVKSLSNAALCWVSENLAAIETQIQPSRKMMALAVLQITVSHW